jgi:hypothetical protein
MSIYLYTYDTTPANAAQISADSGEIVHVDCATNTARREYADALLLELEDENESGGGDAELEIVGTLNGQDVRVHLAIK